MATYITLANFTDQGIKGVKDTTKRAAAVQEVAKRFGASMPQIYWTMGAYDLIAMVEAPDDLSASAFSLAIGMAGNIRGQTLRAFNKDEMNAILTQLG